MAYCLIKRSNALDNTSPSIIDRIQMEALLLSTGVVFLPQAGRNWPSLQACRPWSQLSSGLLRFLKTFDSLLGDPIRVWDGKRVLFPDTSLAGPKREQTLIFSHLGFRDLTTF